MYNGVVRATVQSKSGRASNVKDSGHWHTVVVNADHLPQRSHRDNLATTTPTRLLHDSDDSMMIKGLWNVV